MYSILVKSHSGLRWIFIIAMIFALVSLYKSAFSAKQSGRALNYSKITLAAGHFQFLLGLILYFISPKVIFSASSMKYALSRFYLIEHISLMVIALVIMTIFYSKNKKLLQHASNSRKLFFAYLVAFLIILISIPWPFRNFGTGWF